MQLQVPNTQSLCCIIPALGRSCSVVMASILVANKNFFHWKNEFTEILTLLFEHPNKSDQQELFRAQQEPKQRVVFDESFYEGWWWWVWHADNTSYCKKPLQCCRLGLSKWGAKTARGHHHLVWTRHKVLIQKMISLSHCAGLILARPSSFRSFGCWPHWLKHHLQGHANQ